MGKPGLEGVHEFMGNLQGVEFETEAEGIFFSLPGFQEATEKRTVPASQVQSSLKLFATEAKKEVKTAAVSS